MASALAAPGSLFVSVNVRAGNCGLENFREPLGEDLTEDWEGCLSVPGLRGLVPRHRRIRYRGFDAAGVPIDRIVSGFHARVVQHECDHLDGMLYPRRIRDLCWFGFNEEIAAMRSL